MKYSLLVFNLRSLETDVIPLDRPIYNFGRKGTGSKLDIAVDSDIVSSHHGTFYVKDGNWVYKDNQSTNGTFIDGKHFYHTSEAVPLYDGTILQIDAKEWDTKYGSVVIVFCEGDYTNQEWTNFPIEEFLTEKIYIGRDSEECQFFIDSPLLSKKHGIFFRQGDDIYYQDLRSTNGTLINGIEIKEPHRLKDKDVLMIGSLKMIYANGNIFYMRPHSGTNLSIRNLSKQVSDSENFGRKKTILDNINLDITASELVAILGTSGAGKSTLINCVNGYEQATSGSVLINNIDLYKNKKQLKRQIGYVPQDDLLRDDLSVFSTLNYNARIRLPKDTKRKERKDIVNNTLDILGIERELRSSRIRKLSGGQRKRVSIAMELISNPPIIFLDEPTSGLDPETETLLIRQLRKLSHTSKKTLLVITHTLKNLNMFDKVLFLGPGGRICYYGSPSMMLNFFNVDDFVDIYPIVREKVDYYSNLYLEGFYKKNGTE